MPATTPLFSTGCCFHRKFNRAGFSRNLLVAVTALLLPLAATAASFFPVTDTDINLTGDSVFNFDSYTIDSGISVSYLAPATTRIDIISDGDIIIDGTLFAASETTLSLTSTNGEIFISGTLDVYSLEINSDTTITGTVTAGSEGSTGSGLTLGNGSTIDVGTSSTLTIGNIDFTPGTLITPGTQTPVITTIGTFTPTGTGTITLTGPGLTIVPLPPSLLLFAAGLGGLFLRRFKTP
ncbi:MAG TPA: hypothetical protein ENJ64_03885 [Thiotrichales bacterium]|nr:hypothetical protein [Thiotrichales bacterium]